MFVLLYIDPAATTYVIQIVAGIVTVVGAAIGIYWKKIRRFFRNKSADRLEKKLEKKSEQSARND